MSNEKTPEEKNWTEKEYDQVRQIRELVRKYNIGTEGIWEICQFLRKEFPTIGVESVLQENKRLTEEVERLKAQLNHPETIEHRADMKAELSSLADSHRELQEVNERLRNRVTTLEKFISNEQDRK